MKRVRIVAVSVCIVPLITAHAFAGQPPRVNSIKVGFQYLLRQPNASEAPALESAVGADALIRYDSMAVAYVPKTNLNLLRRLASVLGVRLVDRDRDDLIQTGGATFDTREGLSSVPTRGLPPAAYPDGRTGLFVIQFVAPEKPQWIPTIAALGVQPVRPLAVNAYLVGTTRKIANDIGDLPFVQWMEPLHPFLKAWPDPGAEPMVAEFAGIEGAEEARSRVRGMLLPGSDVTDDYRHDGLYAVGKLDSNGLRAALLEPTLI